MRSAISSWALRLCAILQNHFQTALGIPKSPDPQIPDPEGLAVYSLVAN